MTIDEMKKAKKELGYSNAMVAELSGVPIGTVQKIFSGETTAPRYATLQALEQIFIKYDETSSSTIHETALPYLTKSQGEYTIEDCDNLPDDVRVELIDGVIYYMSAPTVAHQMIAGYIHAQLFNHIKSNKGNCTAMISPLSVELNKDNKTSVQPDVLIACDKSKVIKRCVYGAPDFVLEVLSPSTKSKDMVIKLNKYMAAGVKEYWMIDPNKKQVLVYNFDENRFAEVHTFEDTVPIAVLDNKCSIDFKDLYEYISFLYD